MKAELLTPEAVTDHPTVAGRYVAALGAEVGRYVSNVASELRLMTLGEHALPVTIDDGGYGRSYVASPHSAYVLYARREIDLVGLKAGRGLAQAGVGVLDRVLRAADINRVVHLDNWLLSTNLHGGWQGEGLEAARRVLTDAYPNHLLALRTLDAWSSPQLLEAARRDGWILVPARQIWVVDDLERDWRPRNNVANDRRALLASGLTIEQVEAFGPGDAERIAELYRLLYIDRYSHLSPVFTTDYVRLTQAIGMIDYQVARTPDGRIMAVAGSLVRGGLLTPPVVGYDTAAPKSAALYRIASWMFSSQALSQGLKLHGSAGAADFKRRRGARGEIEYMAIYANHLSAGRRAAIRALAAGLETFAAPMMRKRGW